mgnify:CR=1 FL=1
MDFSPESIQNMIEIALKVVGAGELRRRFPFELWLIIASALTLSQALTNSGLVAMLAATAILRASGVLDAVLSAIRLGAAALGWDTRFVDALPVAFLKPLSGSGARAAMLDVMQTHGVDSLAGRMAAVMPYTPTMAKRLAPVINQRSRLLGTIIGPLKNEKTKPATTKAAKP